MAKKGNFNIDRRNDKKMRNNYFTQQIQRNGDNFLETMRPDQIQRDCIRIFREMILGKIDMVKYAPYMANPSLLTCMINMSYSRYTECNCVATSMEYYVNAYNQNGWTVDPLYIETLDKFRTLSNIFSIINVGLSNFNYSKDPSILLELANSLNKYVKQSYLLY